MVAYKCGFRDLLVVGRYVPSIRQLRPHRKTLALNAGGLTKYRTRVAPAARLLEYLRDFPSYVSKSGHPGFSQYKKRHMLCTVCFLRSFGSGPAPAFLGMYTTLESPDTTRAS
jgi:hypothetical protein